MYLLQIPTDSILHPGDKCVFPTCKQSILFWLGSSFYERVYIHPLHPRPLPLLREREFLWSKTLRPTKCGNSLFLFTSVEFHFKGPQNTLDKDDVFNSDSKRGGRGYGIEAKLQPLNQSSFLKSINPVTLKQMNTDKTCTENFFVVVLTYIQKLSCLCLSLDLSPSPFHPVEFNSPKAPIPRGNILTSHNVTSWTIDSKASSFMLYFCNMHVCYWNHKFSAQLRHKFQKLCKYAIFQKLLQGKRNVGLF